MTASKESRFTLAFFLAAVLPPAGVFLSKASGSLFCALAGTFLLLLAAIGWGATEKLAEKKRVHGALLALGTLSLVLMLPEAALRAANFRYESRLEFGFPRPEYMYLYQADPDLFWVFHPGPGINRDGFRSAPLDSPKEEGTFRILLLGDSCIFKYFPEMLQKQLSNLTDKKIEIVNLAVPGYSSFQGRRAAEKYGQSARADLVIVSFGWNDHWLAYDSRDSGKKAPEGEAKLLAYTLHHWRLLQGTFWLMDHFKTPLKETRVLPDEYKDNLSAIHQVFKPLGVPVVFFTAASSHESLGVEDAIVQMHFGTDADSIRKLHKAYNEIVRQTALGQGGILLDLEASLKDRDDLNVLFKKDGIHFTDAGFEVLVRQTAEFLISHQFVPLKKQPSEAR